MAILENCIPNCMTYLADIYRKVFNVQRSQIAINYLNYQIFATSKFVWVCSMYGLCMQYLCLADPRIQTHYKMLQIICCRIGGCVVNRILFFKPSNCIVYVNCSSSERIHLLAVCRTILPCDWDTTVSRCREASPKEHLIAVETEAKHGNQTFA